MIYCFSALIYYIFLKDRVSIVKKYFLVFVIWEFEENILHHFQTINKWHALQVLKSFPVHELRPYIWDSFTRTGIWCPNCPFFAGINSNFKFFKTMSKFEKIIQIFKFFRIFSNFFSRVHN